MSTEEKIQLLNHDPNESMAKNGLSAGSKLKETLLIIAILFNLTLIHCVDTMPLSFFNYEAKKRGLKDYQTGIIMGCYDFGRIIAAPVAPLIISQISAKKSMILGAAICGTASVIFGLISYLKQPEALFALFTMLRTVSGNGCMLFTVSSTSILMQSKFYSDATIFGAIQLTVGLGFTLGGLIGGVLMKLVGFTFSFIVVGGTVFLSAIPCVFCVPNIVDVKVGGKTQGFSDFIKLPGAIIVLMVCAAGNAGTAGVLNMTGSWVVETFDVPISTWSMYFAVAPLMYLIGNTLASVITNRGYVYSTMLASAPGYILCFLFMCPSPLLDPLFNNKHFLPMTVILFGLHSFLEPYLFVPSFQALVNIALANGHSADSVNTYAIISAAVNFSWAFGATMGAPLTGVATQYIGFPWATTIIALLDCIVITILVIFLVTMKLLGKPLS